ncbi:hypothetical protein BDQ12DRAFT_400627 [Crucibulum laeve]|uniref:Uncharacterized protein n=1 Tax=Crucibulum laeve TaxID=68775 RepID=A0A5C3LNN3_9AGAR|nr:hypothetical protein BDQ12DRAFT_400627 [Crucibulum laeve]
MEDAPTFDDIDHEGYNTIRLLCSANAHVQQKLEEILQNLGDTRFYEWENQFGMCLVHRHFKLKEDEVVLERDLVSQPEASASPRYPERWVKLDDKYMAYEFTNLPTSSPPKRLWDAFIEVVGNAGMSDVLGLFYLPSQILEGKLAVETASEEKRMNTVEYRSTLPASTSTIRSGWRIGSLQNKSSGCVHCTGPTHV